MLYFISSFVGLVPIAKIDVAHTKRQLRCRDPCGPRESIERTHHYETADHYDTAADAKFEGSALGRGNPFGR